MEVFLLDLRQSALEYFQGNSFFLMLAKPARSSCGWEPLIGPKIGSWKKGCRNQIDFKFLNLVATIKLSSGFFKLCR
jgi:hypothetical protein